MCSFALMPKCSVVIPMYDIVESREHVNLYRLQHLTQEHEESLKKNAFNLKFAGNCNFMVQKKYFFTEASV